MSGISKIMNVQQLGRLAIMTDPCFKAEVFARLLQSNRRPQSRNRLWPETKHEVFRAALAL